MKKYIYSIAIMTIMVFIANSSAYTQTCTLVGNSCEGTCGTWYFRNTQNPMVAGFPECRTRKIEKTVKGKKDVKYECYCYLEHGATTCTSIDHKLCEGTCPPVYATLEDAMSGDNPIPGKCDVTLRTGDTEYCYCSYTK